MSEYVIACETFARLSNVLKLLAPEADEWTNSIRLEGKFAVATNRRYMAVEMIGGDNPAEAIHVIADEKLIEQCRTESAFHSKLHIVPNAMLKFASAKTTLGYQYPGNAVIYSDTINKIDGWRAVVPSEVAKKTNGAMALDLPWLSALVESAPSKKIVFQEYIDWTKVVVVRDFIDPNWFAVFHVRTADDLHDPAVVPGWFK